MTQVEFTEDASEASETIERTWRRAFNIAGKPGTMRTQRAKTKSFRPDRVKIEFFQRDSKPPIVYKVAVSGKCTGGDIGMRIFNATDLAEEAPAWLRDKVDSVMGEATGPQPSEDKEHHG